MEERSVRLDSAREQLVDESRIEIDALLVDGAGTLWENAPPRDAEFAPSSAMIATSSL